MPSPVRYAVVQKMLESNGWTFKRSKGSHFHFTKAGHRTLVIAVHGGKVKWGYVRQVEKIIEEDRKRQA